MKIYDVTDDKVTLDDGWKQTIKMINDDEDDEQNTYT